MTETRLLSKAKLSDLIDETESTLADLKAEMSRREQAAQHEEIDHLEEHIASVESGLRTIRDFFRLLVADAQAK